jgi:hypothetical protein
MRVQASPTDDLCGFSLIQIFVKKSCEELYKWGYKQIPQMTFVFFPWILFDSEFWKKKSREELAKVRIQRGLLVTFVFSSLIFFDTEFQKEKSLGRISKVRIRRGKSHRRPWRFLLYSFWLRVSEKEFWLRIIWMRVQASLCAFLLDSLWLRISER